MDKDYKLMAGLIPVILILCGVLYGMPGATVAADNNSSNITANNTTINTTDLSQSSIDTGDNDYKSDSSSSSSTSSNRTYKNRHNSSSDSDSSDNTGENSNTKNSDSTEDSSTGFLKDKANINNLFLFSLINSLLERSLNLYSLLERLMILLKTKFSCK
jgi:hypothetical protein